MLGECALAGVPEEQLPRGVGRRGAARSSLPGYERFAILDRAGSEILDRVDKLRFCSLREQGKTLTEARGRSRVRDKCSTGQFSGDRRSFALRVTQNWRVTADNNGSERDIRVIKLRQKVAGCLRTHTGARQFCAIRSHSTTAKHGMHLLFALVMLTDGRPLMPTAAESAHQPTTGT